MLVPPLPALEADPALRPDAEELVRHPSVAGVVADHGSSSSSAYGGGRTPRRQQTTLVPAAARDQGLQVSVSFVLGCGFDLVVFACGFAVVPERDPMDPRLNGTR